MKDTKSFGEAVRKKRLERGWTQDELAERSGLAGKYVGSIERGERDPGLFVMHVLARTFGIPLGELLGACVKLSPKAIEMGHEFDACDEVIQDAVLQLLRAAHLTNKRSKPRK